MGKKVVYRRKFSEKNVYDLANERIEHVFDLFDTVTVAFSGGKDSTIVFNLTYEVAKRRNRLPLRVLFWDEEAIPYETEDYVRIVHNMEDVQLEWYCIPCSERNACSTKSPVWWPWAPEAEHLWVRPMPPEAISHVEGLPIHPPEDRMGWPEMTGLLHPPEICGSSISLLGIRTQESIIRYRAVTNREKDNYIIEHSPGDSRKGGHGGSRTERGNLFKGYPIYDWTTEDVWTAPKKFGWPYNKCYDAMDKAGLSPHTQRVSGPYGEEPLQNLWTYHVCFPDIWDKMSERVPGASTAARYALSELYAFHSKIEKPDNMSWQELIAHYIKKFDVGSQKVVAGHIRKLFKMHFNKTNDPLLEKATHPLSGVSWAHLVTIAKRGDFKGRRSAQKGAERTIVLDDAQSACDTYEREYEETFGYPWKGKQQCYDTIRVFNKESIEYKRGVKSGKIKE